MSNWPEGIPVILLLMHSADDSVVESTSRNDCPASVGGINLSRCSWQSRFRLELLKKQPKPNS